jgi:transcriptional regulator with XRE-family HTH domain
MTSFQITLSPSKRAAGRFVNAVRRKLQKAFAEECERSGLTQTDIARTIGVHRSVINRELRGHKDITLGRVAELASAMGRKAVIELIEPEHQEHGQNVRFGHALEATTDYSLGELIDEAEVSGPEADYEFELEAA